MAIITSAQLDQYVRSRRYQYQVQDGDRLSAIAERHRVPVSSILNANPHKARVRAVGGAVVFRELAAGEWIALGEGIPGDSKETWAPAPPARTVSQQLADAGPPSCPPGTELDSETGQFCLDPNNMPPRAPCPAGMKLAFGSSVYCESDEIGAKSLVRASEGCEVTSPSGGGSVSGAYLPDFRLCMPTDFTGGDSQPNGTSCPSSNPFYDQTIGMCLRPGQAHMLVPPAPGALQAPTCSDAATKWDPTKRACVAAPMSVATPTDGIAKSIWRDPKLYIVGATALAAVAFFVATRTTVGLREMADDEKKKGSK